MLREEAWKSRPANGCRVIVANGPGAAQADEEDFGRDSETRLWMSAGQRTGLGFESEFEPSLIGRLTRALCVLRASRSRAALRRVDDHAAQLDYQVRRDASITVFWITPSYVSALPDPLITASPERLGGTPVFAGTRGSVQSLIDYFEAGHPLDQFLDEFPRSAVSMRLPCWNLPNAH